LALAGSIANINQAFNGIVNQGELDLGHTAGNAIGTGNSLFGLLVQSNSVAKVTGPAGQFPSGQTVPLKLNSGGVFDLNGNSQTIYTIGMTNGVLRNSAAASFSTLNIVSGQVINMVGTNNVNVFDVTDAAAELDINGNVAGGASLVKTGPGLVNLMAATNSYTGNTTVSNGTLTINSEFLSANSTVTIATNAALGNNGILNLNFSDSGTNTVAALVLGGVSKPAGVYNATTDPAYLTGSGSLQVQAVAPPTSTNADLISLVLTPAGTLSPTFGSNVLTYAATEAYTNTPTVTVVNADLTATNRLIFNGSTNLLASAVASSPLSLTLGVTNVVKVQVTAQDGVTVKTYTVNVTRQPCLTTPTLSNSVSGSTLTLSWPADHLGYSLQSQTNSLSSGLTTNWVTVPGSGSVTTTNLPISNGNPTVFYRLVYP
jgi:autotransporter-associated beta strand protein